MTDNTSDTPTDNTPDTASGVPADVTPEPAPQAEGTVPTPEQGYAPPPPAGYAPPTGYAPPPPAPGYGGPQYGAPQGYAPQYAAGAPLSDSDQRLWAVLSHIGGVFVSFLVPLVVWLVFKGRGAFVEDQSKEALNFQITLAIAYVVGAITAIFIVGVFILIAAAICSVVFAIIAAVQSSQGVLYRYPVCIRFIN
ncbi:DUF4870 domain-containing protein [Pengzhenrongella phosphoraccumulans]|uniref:DUF4870 domain-containing protein n=1 Tax=Pengzhenrongella phosphoraccumulans TaxID=3114394 RepID=UPI00388F384C